MLEDYGKVSAGILLYKENKVFLVHLGGPKYTNKDNGYWGIPKGLVENGENIKDTAKREFKEETGINIDIDNNSLIDLGIIITSRGKKVKAYGLEGTGSEQFIKSNTCEIEWPKGSGKIIEIPEVDKGQWFDIKEAYNKINNRQKYFLKHLEYKRL
jgi:predicted NUDIX family NTP pyrophosphohydrolase